MSRRIFLSLALLALGIGQTPTPDAAFPAEAIVSAWFERMNALDDSPESVEALVALYAHDALHIAAPDTHQMGAVSFQGHERLRTMAELQSARYTDVVYRVEMVTAREASETLYYRTNGPWGGPGIAVTYVVAYTRRDDGLRYMVPGAAFFQIFEGMIQRVRLYAADGERAVVEPLGR